MTYEKTYQEEGACFGTYYKDHQAYDKKKGVCYIPEMSDEEYRHEDYIALAKQCFKNNGKKGNPQVMANLLFECSQWQSPETLINEWENNGELDDYPECYGIEKETT